ncbi:hypothetical protein [Streptomyces sp. BA2]|uniref:hypothetical protein n=1 Tax=Streptomyces sp. BA2 TaxID=436595 RepID=UPI0013285C81|nr:hypothetical protein [Streptomyces sp. BA2]MWA08790.1 hypothetical protein [Streptomyces sp. BA2]
MFKRDCETGEEVAHRVTTEDGRTFVTATNDEFWRQTPGATVEEVRGHTHSRGLGFVVERVTD